MQDCYNWKAALEGFHLGTIGSSHFLTLALPGVSFIR